MNPEETNNAPASDEVAAAEAELRAAQETLEAAKARLAELKSEHPAIEPGSSGEEDGSLRDEGEAAASAETLASEDLEVAAVIVDEDTAEVEAVVLEVEAVPAPLDDEEDPQAGVSDAADGSGEGTAPGNAPADEAASFSCAADSAGTASAPADGDREDEDPAGVEASEVSASGGSSCSSSAEPLPDWVPYTTAPAAEPVYGAQAAPSPIPQAASANASGAPSSAPGPVPPPPSAQSSYPEGSNVGGAYSNGGYQQYQPQQPQQPQQPYPGYAATGYGQTPHAGPGAVPPQQPYYGYQQPYYQQPYQQPIATKDHVAAGLLAIFLGFLGIHKFYLGYNTAGFIMLAVTIIGSIFTFGLACGVIWVISIIEGILYLTKSQSEFEQTYVVNKREWF